MAEDWDFNPRLHCWWCGENVPTENRKGKSPRFCSEDHRARQAVTSEVLAELSRSEGNRSNVSERDWSEHYRRRKAKQQANA